MKIITLTTDFGLRDYSVGAVKGAIYTKCPDARIVDISHLVSPFDIFQTAYILKNAYKHFPKGSIHVIGVDAERNPEKRHLLMLLNGHYFIGADNGIFNLLAEENEPIQLFEVATDIPITLFPTLNVFPSVVEKVYKGLSPEQIGVPTDKYLRATHFNPEVSSDEAFIYGVIIYIDHYGNAVSNISRSLFERIQQNRKFEVIFKMFSFRKIYNQYSDIINFNCPPESRATPDGEGMLLFNDLNYLQFSIYKSDRRSVGGASSLFGMDYYDRVSVHFF